LTVNTKYNLILNFNESIFLTIFIKKVDIIVFKIKTKTNKYKND